MTTLVAKQSKEVHVYAVDSFDNGISFGQCAVSSKIDLRDKFALRIADDIEAGPLRSRYNVERHNPTHQLENHLIRLSQEGNLNRSTIYFGTYHDPFHPFEGKFDASMRLLELFQRYRPGHLIIQTRSPLLVIALPILKRLGKHVSINIGIETSDEKSVVRYTPGLPRVEERLKTVTALRRFGIETNIHVTPVLPYGDWKKDAPTFAQLLISHADHIYIRPFSEEKEKNQKALRNHSTIVRLAEDRRFHWLRPDAANPLITAVEVLAPEKLKAPQREHLKEKQLEIFAA